MFNRYQYNPMPQFVSGAKIIVGQNRYLNSYQKLVGKGLLTAMFVHPYYQCSEFQKDVSDFLRECFFGF